MEDIETQATKFAAQIWCRPENEQRVMDVAFARSIADAVKPLLQQLTAIEQAEVEMPGAERHAHGVPVLPDGVTK